MITRRSWTISVAQPLVGSVNRRQILTRHAACVYTEPAQTGNLGSQLSQLRQGPLAEQRLPRAPGWHGQALCLERSNHLLTQQFNGGLQHARGPHKALWHRCQQRRILGRWVRYQKLLAKARLHHERLGQICGLRIVRVTPAETHYEAVSESLQTAARAASAVRLLRSVADLHQVPCRQQLTSHCLHVEAALSRGCIARWWAGTAPRWCSPLLTAATLGVITQRRACATSSTATAAATGRECSAQPRELLQKLQVLQWVARTLG